MKKAVLYLSIALIVVPDIAIAQQGGRPPSGGGARPSPSTRPAPAPSRPSGSVHLPAPAVRRHSRPGPVLLARNRPAPDSLRPVRASQVDRQFNHPVRVALRPSRPVPVVPASSHHGQARRIAPAPAVRPISGRSPARPSAIPMAITIGAGRSACSCRRSSSPAIIITMTIGAWDWARRPMAIAGCAMAPTCCWSRSGRAAWSMSSMAPSTEAETRRAASSDAALFSCPDHSPRRVKRKTVAGGKLRTVWPARTTSKPSWSSTTRLTGGRVE